MEDNLWWKTPLMEDNLSWKLIYDTRWPLMGDDLWWEACFDRRHPSMEDEWDSKTLKLRDIETRDPKFISDTIFFFKQEIFSDPNIFQTKNFLGPNIFFCIEIFFWPKNFQTKCFLETWRLTKNTSEWPNEPIHTKSNLLIQTYQATYTKPNLQNQAYLTIPTKLILPNQTNISEGTK